MRNRVCFESDRGTGQPGGNLSSSGKKNTTNLNHMSQTPTVRSGIRTRVLRGDKRESNLVATPRPLIEKYLPIKFNSDIAIKTSERSSNET